jgi:hypothetical protein
MKRLSRNQIEEEIEMFETLESQIAARNQQEQARADRDHTWINFSTCKPLTDAQLTALREAAQKCGRPLSDAERATVLGPLQGSTSEKIRCLP